MFYRVLTAVLGTTLMLSGPAFSADYWPEAPTEMRSGYGDNWDMSDNGDPLDFEFGVRYFYSIGSRQMSSGGSSYDVRDQSHTLELHGRIDDNSTGTYLKGYGGFAGAMSGTTSSPLTGGEATTDRGELTYLLGDFGYLGFGADAFRFGPFVGYQFLAERADVTASAESILTETHMLRLGVAAKAEISDVIDLQAEVALVPYAAQTGTAGGGVNLDSNLFGLTADAMVGFHATDSVTIRAGGRTWYLTDSFENAAHTNFRYGGLVELTYAF